MFDFDATHRLMESLVAILESIKAILGLLLSVSVLNLIALLFSNRNRKIIRCAHCKRYTGG